MSAHLFLIDRKCRAQADLPNRLIQNHNKSRKLLIYYTVCCGNECANTIQLYIYMLLSILMIFVALMAKYSNHNNLRIKYVIDNLALVNRSNAHLKYKHPYPNNTLSSEYYITEQIYLTNTTYKIDASFQHVYGH